mmetsp:Transcript_88061/g.188996  ORF Transcript_88061/g.188996 Transcript_88061/m.188996 type:complete len:138 (-) Transcript_88061:56-469(-)
MSLLSIAARSPLSTCWCHHSQAAGAAYRRLFCSQGDEDGDSVDAFWRRRYRKIQRRRCRMYMQVDAAHTQLRAFYEMGREQLVAQGRLSEEEAARFARIDERLFRLQRKPKQLEFYDRRKQFHAEWIQKHFEMKPGV